MVKLVPYSHQVTGHDCLLTTEDKSIICKVRHRKEFDFYSNMDASLKAFAPKFQGVVDVTVLEDAKGYCRFEAHSNGLICDNPFQTLDNTNGINDDDGKIPFRSADPGELSNEEGFHSNDFTRDPKFHDSKIMCDTGQNPWVDRVHRIGRHVKYIGRTIPYIVLENVSATFERPCILDLKMGTQIHDHDCPQEKQLKHVAKNKLTTTCTMGMRLCGLQVYEHGSYHCRDKYYGRGLSDDGLQENFKLFFSSAGEKQSDVLDILRGKVLRLKDVASALDGYRFNGSSIILLHEGCESTKSNSQMKCKADVRVVDFAHSSILIDEHDGPDIGFIFGLDNLLQVIERCRDS